MIRDLCGRDQRQSPAILNQALTCLYRIIANNVSGLILFKVRKRFSNYIQSFLPTGKKKQKQIDNVSIWKRNLEQCFGNGKNINSFLLYYLHKNNQESTHNPSAISHFKP